VDKFDPHCMDVIFHVCWSSPAAPQSKVLTEEQEKSKQAAEDIEVRLFLHEQEELPGSGVATAGSRGTQARRSRSLGRPRTATSSLHPEPE
jgi:hypothetical protein